MILQSVDLKRRIGRQPLQAAILGGPMRVRNRASAAEHRDE
jgi:hypothetical protein